MEPLQTRWILRAAHKLAWTLALLTTAKAQSPLHPVPAFPLAETGLVLHQHVAAGQPFTVAGPQGVLVGQQQGLFEAWILPVKLLSHLTLQAEVEGYSVPLDLNAMAREIEVRPDRTTITYSHIAVTVRQIMFAPDRTAPNTGAVVLFQVDSVKPVDLTLRFTGEMREMWPKLSSGVPSAEWVQRGPSGFYVLHTDFDTLAGSVALPGAKPGIMAPYQERPQTHPLEFHLHIDPATDRDKFFPLLMAVGRNRITASTPALEVSMRQLNETLPGTYADHAARYAAQAAELTSIQTPDLNLNQDFAWAVTSIGQLRAKAYPSGETGLVAGYYESGDSARPGFGWFFGRDSLYTLYAVNGYGDFALAKAELEFLMRRQRADGKVMHEYSQTAADLDWAALPYQYAAADATPLFLTAMLDYVRASGDLAFLEAHKDKILSAWNFESTHDADHDGIYDNAQGTGWVENWSPRPMPRQEIYLALMDQQGSAAMGQLAALWKDEKLAAAASARAARITTLIEHEYYSPAKDAYAFSQDNGPGQTGNIDPTSTAFPTIAWWNAGPGYTPGLEHPAASLKRWASHDFSTDWGTRDVAESDPMWDPTSYHQGPVWPLFTGWQAMAQYRSGHALAGYASLMQNADLTTAQDPGAVTELLSGAFYEPFGRSTSHQLWSSAMVITPLLRGLFGLEIDAIANTIKVTPHLPADWDSAEVRRVHVGPSIVNIAYKREAASMLVTLHPVTGPALKLEGAKTNTLRLPLPLVELSMPHALPLPGSRTAGVKVLDESTDAHTLHLELEGTGGTSATFTLRQNQPGLKITAEGATLTRDTDGTHLTVPFTTLGYTPKTITLHW